MFLGRSSFLLGRAVVEQLEAGVRGVYSEVGVTLSSSGFTGTHNRWCMWVHMRECACWGGGGQKKKGSDSGRTQFILKVLQLVDLWPRINRKACKPSFVFS